MPDVKKTKFGIDRTTGRLVMGPLSVPLPRSKAGRMAAGSGLVAGGMLGFLPLLGFWMLPLGFVVLSHDLHVVRRSRRRMSVWWQRRKKPAVA